MANDNPSEDVPISEFMKDLRETVFDEQFSLSEEPADNEEEFFDDYGEQKDDAGEGYIRGDQTTEDADDTEGANRTNSDGFEGDDGGDGRHGRTPWGEYDDYGSGISGSVIGAIEAANRAEIVAMAKFVGVTEGKMEQMQEDGWRPEEPSQSIPDSEQQTGPRRQRTSEAKRGITPKSGSAEYNLKVEYNPAEARETIYKTIASANDKLAATQTTYEDTPSLSDRNANLSDAAKNPTVVMENQPPASDAPVKDAPQKTPAVVTVQVTPEGGSFEGTKIEGANKTVDLRDDSDRHKQNASNTEDPDEADQEESLSRASEDSADMVEDACGVVATSPYDVSEGEETIAENESQAFTDMGHTDDGTTAYYEDKPQFA